jgi:hypothetical protein
MLSKLIGGTFSLKHIKLRKANLTGIILKSFENVVVGHARKVDKLLRLMTGNCKELAASLLNWLFYFNINQEFLNVKDKVYRIHNSLRKNLKTPIIYRVIIFVPNTRIGVVEWITALI